MLGPAHRSGRAPGLLGGAREPRQEQEGQIVDVANGLAPQGGPDPGDVVRARGRAEHGDRFPVEGVGQRLARIGAQPHVVTAFPLPGVGRRLRVGDVSVRIWAGGKNRRTTSTVRPRQANRGASRMSSAGSGTTVAVAVAVVDADADAVAMSWSRLVRPRATPAGSRARSLIPDRSMVSA